MTQNIAQKLTTAWNSGDVSRIAALYALDARMQHPMSPQPLDGRAAIQQLESGMFSAFDQIEWTASKVVQSGNELALEFRVTARNCAPLPTPKGTIPATQKKVDVRGVSILRLSPSGEIQEEHRYFDVASMLAQLGLA